MGDAYTNLGAIVTITSTTTAQTMILDGRSSPPVVARSMSSSNPKAKNNPKTSINLTCSYSIDNKLLDAEQRQFDSIENLYELPGKSECNSLLQPGFASPMTWVYKVPSDEEISGWVFAAVTDFNNPDAAPTVIPSGLTADQTGLGYAGYSGRALTKIRVGDRVTLPSGQQGTVVRAWRPIWGLGLTRLYQVKPDAGALRGGQAQFVVSGRDLRP